jgi:hypothetical protein
MTLIIDSLQKFEGYSLFEPFWRVTLLHLSLEVGVQILFNQYKELLDDLVPALSPDM